MHPNTDIVVPVRGALKYLKGMLETLEKHTQAYRVIFVDDESDKETSEFLYTWGVAHRETLIVRTNKQRWFTRASNLGLRLARTPRVILLNTDLVVDAGWLQEMYDVWDEFSTQNPHKRVGLVGSTLSGPEKRRWAESQKPGYVTGHCWLLSMEAISDISVRRGTPGIYLDEVSQQAIHINSDRFLSYELNDAGYSTVASHKSAVGHYCFGSWRGGPDLGLVFGVKLADVNERYE